MFDFLLGVAVVASIYGILAVSLNLQAGVSGLLDFGLVAFFGIGAYATGITAMEGGPWWLGLLIGLAVSSACGAAVGRLGRTLGAEYWAIATLALAELLRLVILNEDALTNGPQGINAIREFFPALDGAARDLVWLAIAGGVLVACVLCSRALIAGQFGRTLRLLREREETAASLGHDVVSAKVRIMAISAPMAALAGSLQTYYLVFVGPSELEPFQTFIVWTMIVVGGLGNSVGVVVGAFAIQLLYDLTRFVDDVFEIPAANAGGLRILLVGATLLAFLCFRPQGIVPERLRRIRAPG